MYKKLLFILFFSLPIILFAQTIEYFGDTVDFKPGRRSVNAEIRLRNATRNITGGALVNKGGGLLAFRKVLTKVNDSTYLILDDTLHLPTFLTSVVQAVSADWNTLVNKPNLAPVALSNDYNDLVNKPSFTGTGDTIINNYDSIVIHNDTTINNYYGNAPPDTISINVVRDFGFVPDGVTDNYNQSIALRNFINARHGYAEIIYPQGRYYINQYRKSQPIYDSTIVLNDPEDTSATAKADTTITQVGYTPNGIQNFNYIDCNALTIKGIGGVEIVLNGAFDRAVTRTDAQNRKYSDYNTVIPLSFTRCDNVNISNITIRGGNQYMTENDPSVFEGDGHGLVIKSCSHFIVQNVNIYNIETDAVYIETTSTDYKASHDLSFSNCIWSHAGRQACTVGSAYDVYFDKVQFISTRDTTGGAMGAYPGNAPGKGCDIEPNFSPFGKMKGIWTQNINYNNCIFKDNRGGSIAFSLADRIRGINITNTELNDTLYNHKYAMITGVLDVLVKDCHIYTGTGQLYPVWHFGTAQRGKWINNYIETGSEGFVVATKAQFGLILDGNTVVGKHSSTWHGYFPSINGPCTYINNKHFIDAPLYADGSTRLGIIQGATTSAGNFFYSEKDSSFSDYYHINYASTKTVDREFFNLDDAVRPLNEDAFFTDGTAFFSAGAHGQGSVQEYNVIGNKKLKQYWLNDVPATGIYNVGDRIQMINPLAAGGIDHFTVRTGGNAALGQVQYDTIFTGRTSSGNAGTVDLTNYYNKSQSDARYATVANLNAYLLSTDAAATYKPLAYVPAWGEITGKPTLFSGSYIDLTDKPDLTSLHTHANKTILDNITAAYTTAEQTKLAGIAAGATNVTNTNQLTNGAGFITSEADASALKITNNLSDLANAATARTNLGLGNVENKSSATIRSEINASNVNTALGYTAADAATLAGKEPTITASNTVKQYWTGYKTFATLNLDSIANGTTNMFEVSQSTAPTTTAGRLWNNTSFVNPPNSNSALIWNPGLFYADGSRFIPLTIEGNGVYATRWNGDSWTANYNLASANNGFVNKVSYYKGWSVTNSGVSGSTIVAVDFTTGVSDLNFLECGINDMRTFGYAGVSNYAAMVRNWAVWKTAGTKVNGTSGTKTTPSDWVADSILFNFTTATRTTVNNSPITFSVAGSTVYTSVAYMSSSDVVYNVTIDGVSRGTYSAASSGYTVSGTNPNNNAVFYCQRFADLGDTLHSVVLQKVSGTGQFRVIYVASNASPRVPFGNGGSRAFVTTVGRMTKGNSTTGYTFWGGSDTLVNRYNNSLNSTVYQLAKDGLNVSVIDVNNYYSPRIAGFAQADSLHPTDAGHTAIAKGMIEQTSTIILPKERQIINTVGKIVSTDSSGNTNLALTGKITLDATNTVTGTTGAQTINKASGTVNIAAAGTSVTVTNSLVTTSSIVMAVIRTNDANATAIKSVVPASGSFTINLTTAPAAEISVGFIVYN